MSEPFSSDIDFHRLAYANPKNTIIRFVNWKFCYQALDKKMDLHNLDSRRLDFNPVKTLYFRENFTPRSVIKIRRTANESALSIKNDNDLKSIYPDFVFRDR